MNACHVCHFRGSHGRTATMLVGVTVLQLFGAGRASTALRSSRRVTADGLAETQNLPQPAAGDLVSRVKSQLAVDHRTLGTVSQALLSVQSNVDHTERSMLGKVLDLQTARRFFTRHEEIDTSNDKLKDDVSKLNTQVEGLSSTLSQVQRHFLATAQANRKAEGQLHDEIIEDETLIKSLNAELAKEDDVQAALKKLNQIHQQLLAEAAEAAETGGKTLALLTQERAATRGEIARHRSLRTQIIKMNNYSIACHASVEKASKKLGFAMVAESKDNQAAILTMQQKKKATMASEQRLLAERALLVSEVKRVEAEEVEEMARVKDLREDLQTLGININSEVRALQAKIDAEKDRLKNMKSALLENTQAEMEDVAAKEALDAHIAKLSKQVQDEQNPILIATTEAQNDALQLELNNAYELWKVSKAAETTALLKVDEAAGKLMESNSSLTYGERAIATARKEGQESFQNAVTTAAKNKAESLAVIEKAQVALASRCGTKWREMNKRRRGSMKKCRAMEDELLLEKAKRSTLEQALKAKAETS